MGGGEGFDAEGDEDDIDTEEEAKEEEAIGKQEVAPPMSLLGKSTLVENIIYESRHPTLKWAQRADVILITIDLPDAKDVKLKLEPEGKFYFSATAGTDNIPYEIDVNLHDKIDIIMMEFNTVGEQVERWVEKYCLSYKERRKQMVDKAFEAREKDSGFSAADMDFDSAICKCDVYTLYNIPPKRNPEHPLSFARDSLQLPYIDLTRGDEDDSDTEEEVKEEEAIGKQAVAPHVSNQVKATT
ncbi:HSP20-like chaperone [Tanacetum coccineum]